jgi:hypothetical protein
MLKIYKGQTIIVSLNDGFSAEQFIDFFDGKPKIDAKIVIWNPKNLEDVLNHSDEYDIVLYLDEDLYWYKKFKLIPKSIITDGPVPLVFRSADD